MPIVDYEDDGPSVAINIDSPTFSALHAVSCHGAFPVAVELGPDSSTSGNGGATSMLLHTVPLPFMNDPEASSLSISINAFRLDDRTTKSIAASNRIPSHPNQGGKIDARIFSASQGENLAGIPWPILQPDSA